MEKCRKLLPRGTFSFSQTRALCSSVLSCSSVSNQPLPPYTITPAWSNIPFTTNAGFKRKTEHFNSSIVTPLGLPPLQKAELLNTKAAIEYGQIIPGLTLDNAANFPVSGNGLGTGFEYFSNVSEFERCSKEDNGVSEDTMSGNTCEVYCSSILKKRRKKMNKHKYRKWRKRMRFLRRKLGK